MNTTSEQYKGDGVAREPITMEDTEQPQRNDRKRPEAKNFRSEEGKSVSSGDKGHNGKGPEAMEEMEAASGDTRPEIPACVYRRLPKAIQEITNCLAKGHERDVFLTGFFPVAAGALANVRFRYGGHWQRLNLYAGVIANAAAGKASLRHARDVGVPLDEEMFDDAEDRREAWEREKENGGDVGPKPLQRTLYNPGDTSSSNLKKMLRSNPAGVIFETEFKTLATALSQEWGQSRDVFLKSYHNEPVSVGRAGEDLLRISDPGLSMAVSGTPGTFQEVISDTEDGLFSRFHFYAFEDDNTYKPQFETDQDEARDQATENVGNRLAEYHRNLEGRDEPLYLKFGAEVRRIVNDTGNAIFSHFNSQDIPHELASCLKRTLIRALRFAGILTLLHHTENGRSLTAPRSVEVRPMDVVTGLKLALCYLDHSLTVGGHLDTDNDPTRQMTGKQRRYWKALPEVFTTAEANAIAEEEEIDVSDKTLRDWRARWVDKGYLTKPKRGHFEKEKGAFQSFHYFRLPALRREESVLSRLSADKGRFESGNNNGRAEASISGPSGPSDHSANSPQTDTPF